MPRSRNDLPPSKVWHTIATYWMNEWSDDLWSPTEFVRQDTDDVAHHAPQYQQYTKQQKLDFAGLWDEGEN